MNSLSKFHDVHKQFRSHDWRRVRGAFGQIALWPDEYVEEGWQDRHRIRLNVWAFMSEPVYSKGTAKPSED